MGSFFRRFARAAEAAGEGSPGLNSPGTFRSVRSIKRMSYWDS
jgi:hypothetical protein